MTAEDHDTEDLTAIADRLEAALSRIAARVKAPVPAVPADLLARVDRLIESLKSTLAAPPDSGHD